MGAPRGGAFGDPKAAGVAEASRRRAAAGPEPRRAAGRAGRVEAAHVRLAEDRFQGVPWPPSRRVLSLPLPRAQVHCPAG